jgi:hypothetical protein
VDPVVGISCGGRSKSMASLARTAGRGLVSQGRSHGRQTRPLGRTEMRF